MGNKGEFLGRSKENFWVTKENFWVIVPETYIWYFSRPLQHNKQDSRRISEDRKRPQTTSKEKKWVTEVTYSFYDRAFARFPRLSHR